MAEGKVNKLIPDRGFGFIEVDGGGSCFFHRNDCTCNFRDLSVDDRVVFELTENPKGLTAVKVSLKKEEVKTEVKEEKSEVAD